MTVTGAALVLNADDFGAGPETNRAILKAHEHGSLTSASLMVNEAGAREAAQMARDHPALDVGLHVVLSNGRAGLSRSEVPHLADSDGKFRDSPARAGVAYFFSPAARREVEAELAHQFERFAGLGIGFHHVDGHQHLHLNPVVWDRLIPLCKQYAVRWVRVPFEEPSAFPTPMGRRMERLVFRALRRRCIKKLAGEGVRVADRVYGHLQTGSVSEPFLVEILGRLPAGVSEVYMHPGARHGQRARTPSPGDGFEDVELHALLSQTVRDRIQSMGLRLTTFRDLT